MKSRERALAALDRQPFDRLPIKHLAVAEIDKWLGHDFREIRPAYCRPVDIEEGPECEHGIISGIVCGYAMSSSAKQTGLTLANVTYPSDLGRLAHPTTDRYDYASIREQCLKYSPAAGITAARRWSTAGEAPWA